MARGRLWLSTVLVVFAPSCASGPMTLVGYTVPKRQQVAIVIDISDQVNQADQTGAVAVLAETITHRLKEKGIESQLYTSKYDHPKPPRIDVFVANWQGPAIVGKWAGGFCWTKMVVDCSVTLPGQSNPVFSRHFEDGGMVGGSTPDFANDTAESIGVDIVDALARR